MANLPFGGGMGPLAEWEDQMVTDTDTPAPATEPVRVTIDLPAQIAADYQRLGGEGVYLSRDEGLRHALVTAWRFERATHLRLRLDLRGTEDADADDETEEGSVGGESSDDDLGLAPAADRAG